ncbi:hypothetical protein [Rubinisphaera italica]|uniref:Uncharacterized protein n=1 Tax=Rubinisphaera italica TaxID=2527969 RepID=A0A5C5XMR9_9PLAN|nr:hypothetical protein [Rubinisphaera italica]TWT64250.1 hypothetical protein Pan54_50110 [Rubinisphaera italica]
MSNFLTAEQKKKARKQEKIIDNKLSGYVAIGLALVKIQDDKLYEGKFVEYATARFDMKWNEVYRYMRAAIAAKNLVDAGLALPRNIGVAHRVHELGKDDPAEQIELWKSALEISKKPTIAILNDLVQESEVEEIEEPHKPVELKTESSEGKIVGGVGRIIGTSKTFDTKTFKLLTVCKTLQEFVDSSDVLPPSFMQELEQIETLCKKLRSKIAA